jgi:Zn-dependent protease with chaperone function
MSSTVVCHQCQKRWRLKPQQLPRRIKCPHCAAVIEVAVSTSAPTNQVDLDDDLVDDDELPPPPPLPVPKSKAAPSAAVLRKVLAGFKGTVSRQGPTLGYRLALMLTALAIAVLIALYFAIIAATAYGMYWYAMRFIPQALSIPGRLKVFVLALHAALICGGVLLVYSLLLPLLPSRKGRLPGQKLLPSDAPLLHSYVAKISQELGAPVPAEIRLTWDVNASAGYRGGLWGLSRGRLVLSLGAPLIAGMSTPELGGVIAHELGHFSQRGALFLGYFIKRFIEWCAKAYGGQKNLVEQFAEGDADDHVIAVLLRGVLWVVQSIGVLITWLMAMLGLLVTGFVSRQQEYDADRYAADLIGSDSFVTTLRRIHELGCGQGEIFQRGLSYLLTLATSPQGIEDFAAEIVAAADVIAERNPRQINEGLSQPTGWLDSHPSPRDRMAVLRQRDAPGIFRVNIPAYKLYPRLNPYAS